jgi:hypothetical protein
MADATKERAGQHASLIQHWLTVAARPQMLDNAPDALRHVRLSPKLRHD